MGGIYFIILIGVLIFIHEFGHFFFAKLFDVRVDRFAIGMGPVLGPLTYTRGETEYCICAFPIGGYVKMFGMQPEELYDVYGQKLPEAEGERAFVRKPIWQRFIIVLAGPVMNLILPIFIYY
ncbi:MAG: RIP metalloprotease RseP, partial [Myxococcales bacterium]|nr:RIP metalloprotease RseP [Myxococcales bacterium]